VEWGRNKGQVKAKNLVDPDKNCSINEEVEEEKKKIKQNK